MIRGWKLDFSQLAHLISKVFNKEFSKILEKEHLKWAYW